MADKDICLSEIGIRIVEKDMLILSDKMKNLTPSQVRIIENIIDECNSLFE